ncbi:MAG: hypothetical protein IPF99_35015 [Deltaproteobacteria bacterium]|nr:hypothetical protein [Deltaproteobacteria bacterium]
MFALVGASAARAGGGDPGHGGRACSCGRCGGAGARCCDADGERSGARR